MLASIITVAILNLALVGVIVYQQILHAQERAKLLTRIQAPATAISSELSDEMPQRALLDDDYWKRGEGTELHQE